jgi:hypothetical protein
MFLRKERSDAMTNIVQTLAVLVTLLAGIAAVGGLAAAQVTSPLYPDHFKSPSPPHPPVGTGSGIPAPYRLGD